MRKINLLYNIYRGVLSMTMNLHTPYDLVPADLLAESLTLL